MRAMSARLAKSSATDLVPADTVPDVTAPNSAITPLSADVSPDYQSATSRRLVFNGKSLAFPRRIAAWGIRNRG